MDVAERAQEAAEKHLAACNEALYDYDENGADATTESPSVAPYDGCDTCIVREVLYAAWTVIEEHVGKEIR